MEGEPKCVSLVEEFIMSPEDIAHKSVNRFTDKAFNKYIAGQNEHGGCLVEKSKDVNFFLDHIEEEIIDLWHYVQAFRMSQGSPMNRDDINKVKEIMEGAAKAVKD